MDEGARGADYFTKKLQRDQDELVKKKRTAGQTQNVGKKQSYSGIKGTPDGKGFGAYGGGVGGLFDKQDKENVRQLKRRDSRLSEQTYFSSEDSDDE